MQTGVKVVLVDFYLLKVKKSNAPFPVSVTVLSLTATAILGRQTSHKRAEICGGEVLCPNREDPTSHIKEKPNAVFALTGPTSSCLRPGQEPEHLYFPLWFKY